MKYLLLAVLAVSFSGCVSFGIECKREDTSAWVRVKRVGFGVSKVQAESLATFKEKVCR